MSKLDTSRANREPKPAKVAEQTKAGFGAIPEWALLYVAICVGSVIGGLLRALTSFAALAWFGPGFPWGTLIVNIIGSFVIGFYGTLTGPGGRVFAGVRQRQFVMTGVCGGFTTFSMFSLETFMLFHGGNWRAAGLNVGISVVTWLVAVWFGHILATRLNRLGGV
jgi:fluoride exporter